LTGFATDIIIIVVPAVLVLVADPITAMIDTISGAWCEGEKKAECVVAGSCW
jgi:hypothetical protein